MNRDLYASLRADVHPVITFRLDEMNLQSEMPAPGERYDLVVRGRLTVADSTRSVSFEVRGHRRGDGRFHGAGSTDLRMSSFGIEPPSALFGLIDVKDRITVSFDVTAVRTMEGGEAAVRN